MRKASIIQRVGHAQSVVIGKGVTGLRMKCCIDKKQGNHWVIEKNGELVVRAEARLDLQGIEGIGVKQ
jgi:hypothetical protein